MRCQGSGTVCAQYNGEHGDCGAHLYSRDSILWHTSTSPAYSAATLLANGTAATLKTRQRPQLVLSDDAARRPLVLFNGGSFEGGNCDLADFTHTFAFAFN